MIHFYDFEVFKHDWLVVIIDPTNRSETVIVNDREKLIEYYNKYKGDIWVGYNSRNYDQYILKAILCDFDPKEVNDYIIAKRQKGWSFSSLFRKFPLYNYDVAKLNDGGLKTLESFMGNDICETSVPFNIQRKLTEHEIAETIKYCRHDVEQTIEVFCNRIDDFNAHMSLIKTFQLPLSYVSKTQAQLSAAALECEKVERFDEWEITIVDTLRLSKYKYVLDWFKEQIKKKKYSAPLKTKIAGVEHSFGWGGVHGAIKKYHGEGLILHVDVNSYYPSLMLRYGFLTRNSKSPEKYREIYETRLALKHAGKKKEQAPYKIVLNATFGICKDRNSAAYDPLQANNICINGQLLLLDLIEKLEVIPGFQLIQSNTDGLIIKIPDTDRAFEMADDICYEWEHRTGMGLGFDIIDYIYQKDVNNYLFHFADVEENEKNRNKLERKGAYMLEYNVLKNDLTIVNQAMVEYMVNRIPVEKTIGECSELSLFQKVVKISDKYEAGWHNRQKLNDKTYRVFASKNSRDGFIGKQKSENATIEKFANTPDHCFVINTDIKNVPIPDKVDIVWYIDLAKKRLSDYGVEV